MMMNETQSLRQSSLQRFSVSLRDKRNGGCWACFSLIKYSCSKT